MIQIELVTVVPPTSPVVPQPANQGLELKHQLCLRWTTFLDLVGVPEERFGNREAIRIYFLSNQKIACIFYDILYTLLCSTLLREWAIFEGLIYYTSVPLALNKISVFILSWHPCHLLYRFGVNTTLWKSLRLCRITGGFKSQKEGLWKDGSGVSSHTFYLCICNCNKIKI